MKILSLMLFLLLSQLILDNLMLCNSLMKRSMRCRARCLLDVKFLHYSMPHPCSEPRLDDDTAHTGEVYTPTRRSPTRRPSRTMYSSHTWSFTKMVLLTLLAPTTAKHAQVKVDYACHHSYCRKLVRFFRIYIRMCNRHLFREEAQTLEPRKPARLSWA